ncbi:MAG: MraY family glycosyltransferase, partial [Planctomycetota bacterium]|nr:MraY family glycosyltransferase [Planctomycetota bacterium]
MIDNEYLISITMAAGTAAALSALITCLAIRVAPRIGFVDCPDGGRKRHRQPIPVLGGLAVLVALLVGVFLLPATSPSPETELIQSRQFVIAFAVAATLLCGLGLIDDRYGMRARYKFAGQVVAILPFAVWGCSVESLNILGLGIHLGPTIGIVFAMLWLVSCTNAVNLIDGLDGLAGSIGVIAAITIGFNAVLTGQWQAAALAFVFAASICGFLIFNWPPARIFFGDSGSMTIGFVVGALALGASVKKATGFALVVPLVLVSVPAFDTLMAILRRKLNGRSLGEPDRRHFHHRLKDRGLSDRAVLLLIASVCLGMAACAVVATYFKNDWIAVAGCVGILSLLMVARIFGHEEARLAVRHAQTIAHWWTD